MEKLLNSIPKEKQYGVDKNKVKIVRGFCLRYSVNRKKWVCGYGGKMRTDTEFVEGYDPIEVLADFVDLINK